MVCSVLNDMPSVRHHLDSSMQEVVILETKNAHAATKEILALHSIPAAVSKNLLEAVSIPEEAAVATAA